MSHLGLCVGAFVRLENVKSRPEFCGHRGQIKELLSLGKGKKHTHAEVQMVDRVDRETLRVHVDRLVLFEPPRKRQRRDDSLSVGRSRPAEKVIDLDVETVVLLDDDDDEEPVQSKASARLDVVDLCDSDGEEPAPQPQLGIKRRLPAFVCDKSWSEESGEEEWTGYDAAKDVIAQERRSLEDWARGKFSECPGGIQVTEIWHNPNSYPGENLYEAFAAGYKLARHTKRIELKFHGTPEANIDSICEHGLDPARRSGQVYGEGEYFGGTVADSLGYCRGGTKMIVFAVLMDGSGLTYHGAGGQHKEVTVVKKSHHHVPIAVITFSKPDMIHDQASAGLQQVSRQLAALASRIISRPKF